VPHKKVNMESPFLIDFLKNVGDSVHSINTIVVGLTSIESGEYKKPKDLTITWNTSDNAFSARRARKFALKSALIYVDDALSTYLKDIRILTDNKILVSILSRSNPQFDPTLEATFRVKYPVTYDLFNKQNKKATSPDEKNKEHKDLSSIDRIRALSEFFEFKNKYWTPCLVMLVRWRNKIVHRNSSGQLSREELNTLNQTSSDLKNNHANIDIEQTISNFNNSEITLKDFTTLIAISIRYARFIDEQIFQSLNKIETVESYVKRKKQIDIYNSISTIKNETIRKRKFGCFIITNISPLDDETINSLYPSFRAIQIKTKEGEELEE
jgi:hypothetical protein